MVVYTYNPNSKEPEAGRLLFEANPGPIVETLSQKQKSWLPQLRPPKTWEAESRGTLSLGESQSELYGETCLKKQPIKPGGGGTHL